MSGRKEDFVEERNGERKVEKNKKGKEEERNNPRQSESEKENETKRDRSYAIEKMEEKGILQRKILIRISTHLVYNVSKYQNSLYFFKYLNPYFCINFSDYDLICVVHGTNELHINSVEMLY